MNTTTVRPDTDISIGGRIQRNMVKAQDTYSAVNDPQVVVFGGYPPGVIPRFHLSTKVNGNGRLILALSTASIQSSRCLPVPPARFVYPTRMSELALAGRLFLSFPLSILKRKRPTMSKAVSVSTPAYSIFSRAFF